MERLRVLNLWLVRRLVLLVNSYPSVDSDRWWVFLALYPMLDTSGGDYLYPLTSYLGWRAYPSFILLSFSFLPSKIRHHLCNFLLMGRVRKQCASESSILASFLQLSNENFLKAYIGFFSANWIGVSNLGSVYKGIDRTKILNIPIDMPQMDNLQAVHWREGWSFIWRV